MSGLESHLSLVTAPFDIPVRDGLDHCELGKSSERCRWVVGYWIWLHWFFYLCDPIHNMYINVYICMCMSLSVSLSVRLSVCLSVCMFVCLSVCLSVCMYIYIYVCVCNVCLSVCVCIVCMSVCMHRM